MNANMRIGRAKHAGLATIFLAAGFLAATGMAQAEQRYDAKLQKWAAKRVAEKVSVPLRGTYEPDEALRLVTLVDLEKEPVPLDARLIEQRQLMLDGVRAGSAR